MDYFVTILSVVFSSLTSIIVCIINNNTTRKKHDQDFMQEYQRNQEKIVADYRNGIEELKKNISDLHTSNQLLEQSVNMRLDVLEQKQDKHNSVIERTYKLERDVAVLMSHEN